MASVYPKECEELSALQEATQETCELIRAIAAKVVGEAIQKKQVDLALVVHLLPTGLDDTGT